MRFRLQNIHDFIAGGYREDDPRCLTVRGEPRFLLVPFRDVIGDGIHEFVGEKRCRRCKEPEIILHGTLAKDQ